MFVALTQVDFMFIRIAADLLVNAHTTYYFLRGKIVNAALYNEWKNIHVRPHADNSKTCDECRRVVCDDSKLELLDNGHSQMIDSELPKQQQSLGCKIPRNGTTEAEYYDRKKANIDAEQVAQT
jgi:hypothetical protein